MRWARPAGLDVDAVCCAWLIRRFVDPDAEFIFVAEGEPVPADARPFAVRSRNGGKAVGDNSAVTTSFAQMLDDHGLDQPALHRMAAVVHDAAWGVEADWSHEGASLDVLCRGLILMHSDERVLELTGPQLDHLLLRLSSPLEEATADLPIEVADDGVSADLEPLTPEPGATARTQTAGFGSFLRYFLGLGTWGFGGPIATVGYMQRDLVEQRKWLDRQEFLDGVALGQTMPGPLAAQVAMWVGYLQRGALGALAVAGTFILPSFILVLTVAIVYVRYSGLAVVQSLFYGIAPGVMAIIAIAAWKLAKLTDAKDRRLWAISIVIGVVTAATGAEIALLFVAAGLVMMLWDAPPRFLSRHNSFLWLGSSPLAVLLQWTASGGTLVALTLFFVKSGAFIFGSGLAIVPFLREGVVNQHHWLSEREFLDAVAMGLITPGPVVITATFIGYLVAGITGAVLATIAIFTPIYLGVVIPGRWFVRHRNNRQVQAFVKGATAAAAGAIAGATVVLARQAIVDYKTGSVAVIAFVLLWRFKTKEPLIVAFGAAAGLLLH